MYVRVSRMHHEIKFRNFYFRVLYLLAKNVKFLYLAKISRYTVYTASLAS